MRIGLARAALAAAAAAAVLAVPACRSASTAPAPSPAVSAATSPGSQPARANCDASLWAHIYHAYRLHVIKPCRTVTGVVESVKREPDGDLHIDLAVSDKSLINAVNVSGQHGWLVVEAICTGTVTQADAVAACAGFTSSLTTPRLGQTATVTGSYVLDADHGWLEIHPVSSLRVR